MTATAQLKAEIREAITVLQMLDWIEEARTLRLDLARAGDDLRELLMVRAAAERLADEAALA